MREILIIRFGAMGDLCLLTWAMSRLRSEANGAPARVTLVTKAQFAPLMAEVHGIDEVLSLSDSSWSALSQLASVIRKRQWDIVIDAHHTLRSVALLGLIKRRPAASLAKDTVVRLAFMKWGRSDEKLSRTLRERYFDLIAPLVKTQTNAATPPLGGLKKAGTAPDCLGLAPGAQWDSKRWPEENFAQLISDLLGTTDCQLKIFLGPREQIWYPTSALAKVVASDERVTEVQVPDLVAVAKELAKCRYVVTNDSGILHLSEAVGTPVLAFFGPTVREFGYFPLLANSRVLEHELSCRPCSRNGKRACHRGDLACLVNISPDMAFKELQSMLAERPTS